MPTRFFPTTLFASMQRVFKALDVLMKRSGTARDGEVVCEENSPGDEIRRKDAV
jgi:hypothetical protein